MAQRSSLSGRSPFCHSMNESKDSIEEKEGEAPEGSQLSVVKKESSKMIMD